MSTESSPRWETWDPIILLVASQHELGGVDRDTIRYGVDYFWRVFLTDEELSVGISKLEWAGLIEGRGGRFFLPDAVSHVAPRTATGRISLRKRY